MKRSLITILWFILFLAEAMTQPVTAHLLATPADYSQGKPFAYIEEISEVLIKGIKIPPHRTEKSFNAQGKIISQTSYNSSGGISSEIQWEYDREQRVAVKKHGYFVNYVGWIEEECHIVRDSITRFPVKIEEFKNGESMQWSAITTDSSGRPVTAKVVSSTKGHTFTEKIVYMDAANLVRVNVYRAAGMHVSSWSYPIDASRRMVVEAVSSRYYGNGNVKLEKLSGAKQGDQAYYYEYEYDSQGNWVEKRTYLVTLGKNDRIKKKKYEHRITRKLTYL